MTFIFRLGFFIEIFLLAFVAHGSQLDCSAQLRAHSTSAPLVEDLVPRLNVQSSEFGWDHIKGLTRSSGVSDLKQFLRILPDFMKEQRAFFFDSRSFKSKSKLPAATPENPRVVLANSDSSVLIAANTLEDNRENQQKVEIIVFDSATSTFQPKVILFPKNSDSPVFIDEPLKHFPAGSKAHCGRCHGVGLNFRPIWDTYPVWPGAYGQTHFESNFRERHYFLSTVSRLFESNGVLSGLMTKEILESRRPIESMYDAATRDGVKEIESRLYPLNANRVIRMFSQYSNFQRAVVPLFIATRYKDFETHMMPSSTLEVYQNIQKWVQSQYFKYLNSKDERVKNGSFPFNYTRFDIFGAGEFPTRLNYLGRLFGTQMDYMSLTLGPNSMGLIGGGVNLIYDISSQMTQVLTRLHPELRGNENLWMNPGNLSPSDLDRIQEAYFHQFGVWPQDFLEQTANERW